MHRVELKDQFKQPNHVFVLWLFLMHRVELKDDGVFYQSVHSFKVPNAPCGVERRRWINMKAIKDFVPNAPCGVESTITGRIVPSAKQFLMHRVELKVWMLCYRAIGIRISS